MNKSHLKLIELTDIERYLNGELFSTHSLNYKNLPFSMHWSDAKIITNKVRDLIGHNENYQNFYHTILKTLHKLEHQFLWYKINDNVSEISLYDLYRKIFIEQDLSLSFSYEVSIVGPYGPFLNTNFSRFFNPRIYKNFIYSLLLNKELPQRSFRLQCEQYILTNFKFKFKNKTILSKIKSISDDGILVEFDHTLNLKEFMSANKIGFQIASFRLKDFLNVSYSLSEHHKIFYSRDPLSKIEFLPQKLTLKTSSSDGVHLSYFIYAKFEDALNNDRFSDLENLTQASKEEVLLALDLSA